MTFVVMFLDFTWLQDCKKVGSCEHGVEPLGSGATE
jgi:hypothetical protein